MLLGECGLSASPTTSEQVVLQLVQMARLTPVLCLQQLGEGGLVLRVCAALQQIISLCKESRDRAEEWEGRLEMSVTEFEGPAVNDLINSVAGTQPVRSTNHRSRLKGVDKTDRGSWVENAMTAPISSFADAEVLLRAVICYSSIGWV